MSLEIVNVTEETLVKPRQSHSGIPQNSKNTETSMTVSKPTEDFDVAFVFDVPLIIKRSPQEQHAVSVSAQSQCRCNPCLSKMRLCFVLVVMAVVDQCSSSLNLYVDSDDVKKLLGVSSQLWYVQNGTVNKYALGYVVVVPPHVDLLTFHWQALGGMTMPYNMSVQVGNREALAPPVYNISDQSIVPTYPSSWTIRLICTGKLTTQVDVTITLKVPMSTSLVNTTTLNIRRKKICLRGKVGGIAEREGEVGGISVEILEARHSTTVVYITISCLGVFLLVVAFLAIFNHIKNNKARPNTGRRRGTGASEQRTIGRSTASGGNVPNNQVSGDSGGAGKTSQSSLSELRRSPQPTNTTATTTTTTGSPEPQYTDPRLSDISAKLTGLSVSKETLKLLEVEQEGTFGRVYHAVYQPPDQKQPLSVTVKTVIDGSSEVQRSVLLSEGVMLAGLNHDQLLGVLGAVVTPPEAPPCIIFPRSSQGNLKRVRVKYFIICIYLGFERHPDLRVLGAWMRGLSAC
ncbi:tyrosine-protein kinase Dnt-like [Penaeus indicus]|uniref:tyrosine-protein kinase Dnt-like n=1 Tax=Penaeus indicus TaxID=29960 RepID=UPI00300C7E04